MTLVIPIPIPIPMLHITGSCSSHVSRSSVMFLSAVHVQGETRMIHIISCVNGNSNDGLRRQFLLVLLLFIAIVSASVIGIVRFEKRIHDRTVIIHVAASL
jgi:hypothetical protein